MSSVTLSTPAYLKLYFHSAKHAHQSINGVLIGTQSQPNGPIEVQDSIPLLHLWTSLSPMMEIGLDLAEQYTEDRGLKVVGYYQARATVGDGGLGPVGERIMQRLRTKFADAFAVIIDNDDFGTESIALDLWRLSSNQWKRVTTPSPITLANPDLPLQALSLVKEKELHLEFGDFDDHLEDVKIDWIHNKKCIPEQ